MDKSLKDSFNERLLQVYGKHVEADQARFRVSFSDDEYERREGEFWESPAGVQYSLPVREVRLVPKYPFFDRQWVLEVLTFIPHGEQIASGYTYEPLWAWERNLELKWEAIQRVIYNYINKVKSNNPKTQKEADYQEQERLRRNKAIIKNRLDNTALTSALHDGDAVSFAGMEKSK